MNWLSITVFGIVCISAGWSLQKLISLSKKVTGGPKVILNCLFFAGWVILLLANLWLIPFIVIPFIVWERQKRKAEQSALLWQLAFAIEQKLPLKDELHHIAPSFSPGINFRLVSLAYDLEDGIPLPVALLDQKTLVSRETAIHTQIGLENDNLATVLRNEATRLSSTPAWLNSSTHSPILFLSYLFIVPTACLFVMSYISWSILPKYKHIVAGFGTELPGATKSLISAYSMFSDYLFVIPVGMILFSTGYASYYFFFKRNNKDISLLPGWGWLSRRYRLPTILRMFSESVSGGQPLTVPLTHLATLHPKGAIRKSTSEACLAIEAGHECWQTLCREGLLNRREADLLETAQRTGNLPWMLNELASVIEQKRTYRWTAFLQFLEPVLIVLIGIVVACIVIGLFIPLVDLITKIDVA